MWRRRRRVRPEQPQRLRASPPPLSRPGASRGARWRPASRLTSSRRARLRRSGGRLVWRPSRCRPALPRRHGRCPTHAPPRRCFARAAPHWWAAAGLALPCQRPAHPTPRRRMPLPPRMLRRTRRRRRGAPARRRRGGRLRLRLRLRSCRPLPPHQPCSKERPPPSRAQPRQPTCRGHTDAARCRPLPAKRRRVGDSRLASSAVAEAPQRRAPTTGARGNFVRHKLGKSSRSHGAGGRKFVTGCVVQVKERERRFARVPPSRSSRTSHLHVCPVPPRARPSRRRGAAGLARVRGRRYPTAARRPPTRPWCWTRAGTRHRSRRRSRRRRRRRRMRRVVGAAATRLRAPAPPGGCLPPRRLRPRPRRPAPRLWLR